MLRNMRICSEYSLQSSLQRKKYTNYWKTSTRIYRITSSYSQPTSSKKCPNLSYKAISFHSQETSVSSTLPFASSGGKITEIIRKERINRMWFRRTRCGWRLMERRSSFALTALGAEINLRLNIKLRFSHQLRLKGGHIGS